LNELFRDSELADNRCVDVPQNAAIESRVLRRMLRQETFNAEGEIGIVKEKHRGLEEKLFTDCETNVFRALFFGGNISHR